jgi:hypothetical protein
MRRMWIVRSSVGAATKRPSATNAAGAQASVIAATSGASSSRGSRVRIQPPEPGTKSVSPFDPRKLGSPGDVTSAQRRS